MIVDDTLLLLGAFGVVMVLIIIYIIIKDSEQNKKVSYLEHSIDKLHNQLYTNERELKALQKQLLESEKNSSSQYNNAQIQQLVKEEVKEVLEPIGNALNSTESSMKEFQDSMQNRFESVENHVKQSVMMPQTSKNDEEKIVSMYKTGYSIDEIAKHFRIGTGEVELIIKFCDIT